MWVSERGATNNVLSVLGGAGFGTYATTTAPAGGIIASGNVGIGYTTPTGALAVNGNVGVGTTAPQGSLVVTNGNVGIGTWAPGTALQVGTNTLVVNTATGNIGIGTGTTNNVLSVLGGAGFGTYATTTAPAGGSLPAGMWASARLLLAKSSMSPALCARSALR